MQIDYIKKKMLFLLANPDSLKSIVPKEVFINPTISEDEVSEIEKRNNIILPKGYREFIQKQGMDVQDQIMDCFLCKSQ